MKKEKQGFRIEPTRPAAIISALAFALCIPMQILGYAERMNEPIVASALVGLPVLSALLMIAVDLRIGRNALWFSVAAVSVGVLGFVFKLVFDPRGTSLLHHVSAGVLYIGIVALWALTVFFVIKTKWILAGLFLIPFLKHLFIDDAPVLLGTAEPISASMWFKEISMLSFMLALSLCAMSFEKTALAAEGAAAERIRESGQTLRPRTEREEGAFGAQEEEQDTR